ncbi:MAG: hypothetical protein H7A14_01490 [Sinobacteraceae bacterium]|nr:hypothetical protein [Nevskiaceae bacterium]
MNLLMSSRAPSRWIRAAALAVVLFGPLLLLQGCLDSGGSAEPSISQQPRDRAAFVGTTTTFDIGVGGKGPLSFQWQRNGVAILGATAGTYTTPALSIADDGARYSVIVSNDVGSVTSSEATLAVYGPPTITTQPVAQTVAVGATATFSVAASGQGLTYQWRRNGVAIASATAASYTTAATVAGDDGVAISVDVINGAGIVGSDAVLLTVTATPAVVTGPLSQRAAIGERAVFGVVATGGNLQYQWERDGAIIPGATTNRHVTPPLTVADDATQYTVVISNAQGSTRSAAATLNTVAAAVAAPTTPFAEVATSGTATAAESFTVVRRSNGSVAAWGYGAEGQHGDGTNGSATDTPVTVTLPAGVTASRIAAGGNHALLLSSTGDVYAWGRNTSGQLGAGDQQNRNTPTQVTLPDAAVSIAAGREFSVAVLADGRVFAWGLNSDGQLGTGNRFSSFSPAEVTGITQVTAVAAGNSHVLALRSDGSVWAWGANAAGQLGTGDFVLSRVPVATAVQQDVVRIRAGGDLSLAITSRRIGLAWGENSGGQLGLTSLTTNDVPTPVGVQTDVVDAAGADMLSLFVGADGVLRAAGSNETGSLGDGTTTARGSYGAVNGIANAITAAVGGRSFGLAIRADGRLLSWGDNNADQLGNPALSATGTSTPAEVPNFSAGP